MSPQDIRPPRAISEQQWPFSINDDAVTEGEPQFEMPAHASDALRRLTATDSRNLRSLAALLDVASVTAGFIRLNVEFKKREAECAPGVGKENLGKFVFLTSLVIQALRKRQMTQGILTDLVRLARLLRRPIYTINDDDIMGPALDKLIAGAQKVVTSEQPVIVAAKPLRAAIRKYSGSVGLDHYVDCLRGDARETDPAKLAEIERRREEPFAEIRRKTDELHRETDAFWGRGRSRRDVSRSRRTTSHVLARIGRGLRIGLPARTTTRFRAV